MMLGKATSDGPDSVDGKQRGDRPDENAGLEAVTGWRDVFGPGVRGAVTVHSVVQFGGGVCVAWGRVDLQSSLEHRQHEQRCGRSFAFSSDAVSSEWEPERQPEGHADGGSGGVGRMHGIVGRVREQLSAGAGHDRRGGTCGSAYEIRGRGIESQSYLERSDDPRRFLRRYGAGDGDAGCESVLPGPERIGNDGV